MGPVTWDGHIGLSHGIVTWDDHMGGSHGMGHMGWSHGMGTCDDHMGLSHGMGNMGWSGKYFLQNWGYTKCLIYKYQTKFQKHLPRKCDFLWAHIS